MQFNAKNLAFFCHKILFSLYLYPKIFPKHNEKEKSSTPYLQCMLMQANVFAYIWYQEILPHQQIW